MEFSLISVSPAIQALLLGFDLVRKALCQARFVSVAYLADLVRGEHRTQPLSEEDPLVVLGLISDVLLEAISNDVVLLQQCTKRSCSLGDLLYGCSDL